MMLTKFVIYEALFLIKAQEIPRFFLLAVKKKSHLRMRVIRRKLSSYLGMTRTVLFNCPINAEIRAVDSQSDLRILFRN